LRSQRFEPAECSARLGQHIQPPVRLGTNGLVNRRN
jgi:hypothetical protein